MNQSHQPDFAGVPLVLPTHSSYQTELPSLPGASAWGSGWAPHQDLPLLMGSQDLQLQQHQPGMMMGLADLAAYAALPLPQLHQEHHHQQPQLLGDELKDMKDHRGNAVRVPACAVVLAKGEQRHNCHCHGKDHNCKIVLRICMEEEHVWCIKYLIEFFSRWHAAQQADLNAAALAGGGGDGGGDDSFTGLLQGQPSGAAAGGHHQHHHQLSSGHQRSLIPFCPLCREICHCQRPCPEPPCGVCCSKPKNKTRKKDYRKRKAEELLAEAHASKHAMLDPYGGLTAAQAMAGLWAHMPPTSAQQLQQLTSLGLVLPPHLMQQHQHTLAAAMQAAQAAAAGGGGGSAAVASGSFLAPLSPRTALDYQQRAAAAGQWQPPQASTSGGNGSAGDGGGRQGGGGEGGFTSQSAMASVLQAMLPNYGGLMQINQEGQLVMMDPPGQGGGGAGGVGGGLALPQLGADGLAPLGLMDASGMGLGGMGLGLGAPAGGLLLGDGSGGVEELQDGGDGGGGLSGEDGSGPSGAGRAQDHQDVGPLPQHHDLDQEGPSLAEHQQQHLQHDPQQHQQHQHQQHLEQQQHLQPHQQQLQDQQPLDLQQQAQQQLPLYDQQQHGQHDQQQQLQHDQQQYQQQQQQQGPLPPQYSAGLNHLLMHSLYSNNWPWTAPQQQHMQAPGALGLLGGQQPGLEQQQQVGLELQQPGLELQQQQQLSLEQGVLEMPGLGQQQQGLGLGPQAELQQQPQGLNLQLQGLELQQQQQLQDGEQAGGQELKQEYA